MRKIIVILVGVLSLTSCQDNDMSLDIEKNDPSVVGVSEYAISPESALASLQDFLGGSNSSRGGDTRKVESIIPIKYRPKVSRAEVDTIVCENLMYIANFENEAGYAILAGDTRIRDRVIALVDNGTLSESIVNIAMDRLEDGKVIFKDYPTTGPGFFTDPRYGDELFINPNTVSFEDFIMQDTLVGNFRWDNVAAEYDNGLLDNSSKTDEEYIQVFTSYLCASFADHALRFEVMPDAFVPIDPIGGNPGFHNRIETFYSDWSVGEKTSNLLSAYKVWHQHPPFNDYNPKRREFLVFGRKRRAPVGCFPMAIAKIMTHFEYPDVYIYNGHRVNWTWIKLNGYDYMNYGTDVAALLKGISEGCSSQYFYQGTWTFPSNAASYMASLGFSNVHRYDYKFERVKNMIDLGKPVIIYAIPGVNIFSAHAWNIDGYKVKERTKTTKKYDMTTLVETITETETQEMVHCDFGWGGSCNGYYVSGVFKLNDLNSEKDNPNDGGKKIKYNHHVRIITYQK